MSSGDSLPNLKDVLDKNFAELKIGEEKFEDVVVASETVAPEKRKIIYQERYSADNQTDSFVAKPISATKKLIEKPHDVKEETVDVVHEENEVSPAPEIVDSPVSKIGDDIVVEW